MVAIEDAVSEAARAYTHLGANVSSTGKNVVVVTLPPDTPDASLLFVDLAALGCVCDLTVSDNGAVITAWCSDIAPKPQKTKVPVSFFVGIVAAICVLYAKCNFNFGPRHSKYEHPT